MEGVQFGMFPKILQHGFPLGGVQKKKGPFKTQEKIIFPWA